MFFSQKLIIGLLLTTAIMVLGVFLFGLNSFALQQSYQSQYSNGRMRGSYSNSNGQRLTFDCAQDPKDLEGGFFRMRFFVFNPVSVERHFAADYSNVLNNIGSNQGCVMRHF